MQSRSRNTINNINNRRRGRITSFSTRRPNVGRRFKARVKQTFDTAFTRVMGLITSIVSEPSVFILTLVAFVLTFSYETNGFQNDLLTNNVRELNMTGLNKYVLDEQKHKKIIGLFWFLPAFLSVPENKKFVALVASLFLVILVPERWIWEYPLQSFLLRGIFRVGGKARIILVGIGVIFYTFNHLFHKDGEKLVVDTGSDANMKEKMEAMMEEIRNIKHNFKKVHHQRGTPTN